MMVYALIFCACVSVFLLASILLSALMKNKLIMKQRFTQLNKSDSGAARVLRRADARCLSASQKAAHHACLKISATSFIWQA